MEANKIPNYVVRYNSDPRLVTDNHKSDIVYLLDTDERNFNDIDEAVKFLSECISPITTIEELVPELKKNQGNFKFIIPERNIKPKHQLDCSMETRLIDREYLWW